MRMLCPPAATSTARSHAAAFPGPRRRPPGAVTSTTAPGATEELRLNRHHGARRAGGGIRLLRYRLFPLRQGVRGSAKLWIAGRTAEE